MKTTIRDLKSLIKEAVAPDLTTIDEIVAAFAKAAHRFGMGMGMDRDELQAAITADFQSNNGQPFPRRKVGSFLNGNPDSKSNREIAAIWPQLHEYIENNLV